MTTSYQTNLELFFYNNTEKQIYQMCVRIFFEERDNEGIIIRCVEPIMYNEHVVSFRQKPLSIVLLPLLLINNFIAAAQLNSPSSKRNNLDSSICMLIISSFETLRTPLCQKVKYIFVPITFRQCSAGLSYGNSNHFIVII